MTDIHDIKPLIIPEWGIDWVPALPWLLLGMALLGRLFLLYFLWRKRRRRAGDARVDISPYERAVNGLEELSDGKFSAARDFYFALSAIFREYIDGRFQVPAPEMTSEELLPAINGLEIDRKLKTAAKEWIQFADPVKFADFPASRERMENDLAFVREFVDRTGMNPEHQ